MHYYCPSILTNSLRASLAKACGTASLLPNSDITAVPLDYWLLGRPDAELKSISGTSLVAQWIRLRTPKAGGPGSIPVQGTRSHMHAATKEPTCCN